MYVTVAIYLEGKAVLAKTLIDMSYTVHTIENNLRNYCFIPSQRNWQMICFSSQKEILSFSRCRAYFIWRAKRDVSLVRQTGIYLDRHLLEFIILGNRLRW